MKPKSIPIVLASSTTAGDKTVFNTVSRKVVVDAPHIVINLICSLCDGTRTLGEVTDSLSKKWDKETIEGLINSLCDEGVVVDGRSLEETIWETVKNPTPFPVDVSEEEVMSLVEKARDRHRCKGAQVRHFPDLGDHGVLISQRESVRKFSGDSVAFQAVINMLWSAYGEHLDKDGKPHRVVPSAGSLYPLKIHVCLLKKTDQYDPGIYKVHYGQFGSVELEHVSNDVLRFSRAYLSPRRIEEDVHGVIVVSGSFCLSGEKYGNRSLLYVPLEAGHAAHSILLEAVEQGVATLELGGFVDELVAEAINLADDYHPLTTVAFGKECQEVSGDSNIPEIDWAIPMAQSYKPDFAIASARLSKDRNWSHGRDPSPRMALTKATSEAKEWTACGCIPNLKTARYGDLQNVIDPRKIISFHPRQYKKEGFPFGKFDKNAEYEWTKGVNLEGEEFHVLADHVYFPYHPENPYYCYSNSSGCAAHPDRQSAVEIGALELVERDAFTNAYLSRLEMPVVKEETLPEHIRRRIKKLKAAGFRTWIVDQSLDLAAVVFVFAQNADLNFTTCAACSSFDVEEATAHALMEVEASVLYRLQHGKPEKIKPSEVIWPNDHGRLYGQPDHFRKANFMVESGKKESFTEVGKGLAKSWPELVERFQSKGWECLVIPLELSDDYGHNDDHQIVRVLVPGMVQMTFGYGQEPAGMQRIYSIAERFRGRRLSYEQLTKFPHPFE